MVRSAAAPATTAKEALAALATPFALALKLYVPLVSRCRSAKVATPATAATVVVPLSVAFPEFVARAIVTASVKDAIVLPRLSRATTWTDDSGAPAVAVEGTAMNARCEPPAGAIRNVTLVVGGRFGELATREYPEDGLSSVRSENDATPLTVVRWVT